MSNPEQNTSNETEEERRSKIWGAIYIILGIVGLAFSVYFLLNCSEMAPLIGAIGGVVFFVLLSILVIIFGYRVINKDY